MRKWISVITAMTFVAGLSLTAATAFAGGACCANKEKASASTDASGATVQTVSSGATCTYSKTTSAGGACGTKSSMAQLFKAAPGTKMEYAKVDGGVALIVTAASTEYVPVVQAALATRIDEMKTMAGGTCAMSAGTVTKVSSGTCADKASATKVSSGATCATTTSATKVSSDHCAAAKTSASASVVTDAKVQTVSTMECPEWMKVLCGANCAIENTSTGVKVIWTTTKKDMVEQLQVAGEKLQADLQQL